MARSKLVLAAAAAAAAAALGVAGCGAREASLVEKAFDTPIKSAQVSLELGLEQGGKRVAELSLRGPVRSNGEGRLQSFDLQTRVSAPGQRPLRARVTSTGENVFVRYGGTTYEVGEHEVAKLNQRAAEERKRGESPDAGDLLRMGIDPRKWFPSSGGKPRDSEVAGEPTRSVSGRLDVSVALRDLAKLLRRPEFRAQLRGQVPDLRPREIKMIDALISDPSFTLDAGRKDGKLRRLTARFTVRDPDSGRRAGVRFELRLTHVDQPVRITAPRSGQPIEKLLKRLGVSDDPTREVARAA
jgi:hypothetical protein